MTETELKIQSTEAAIRIVEASILTVKNARRKAQDIATLASLRKNLEELNTTNEQLTNSRSMEAQAGAREAETEA